MAQESNKPREPGDILAEVAAKVDRLIQTKYHTKQPQDKQEARVDAVTYAALQAARLRVESYVQKREELYQLAEVWDAAITASQQHDWVPLKELLKQAHIQTNSPALQHLSDLLELNPPENHPKARKRSTPREMIDNNKDLTPRQRQILALVKAGKTNAQIAEKLYLSEFTVKQHLRVAYRKLGFPKKRK